MNILDQAAAYQEIRTRFLQALQDAGLTAHSLSRLARGHRFAIYQLFHGAHAPRAVEDPRFLLTLRDLSVALGREPTYLEGDLLLDHDDDTFGLRLRKARLRHGWSISDLGALCGVNYADVWFLERDERNHTRSANTRMRTLARVVGIPPPPP